MADSVSRLEILDTFPDFERYWRMARLEPLEVQMGRWEQEYMAPWPELLRKQQQNYAEAGVDWRQVASTRIFPHLAERLPRMRRLHRNLRNSLPDVWSEACRMLNVDFPVRFVIYVGIGCGAGWATTYGGTPAVLFGLENLAETSRKEGGVALSVAFHEIAHVAHEDWRKRCGLRGLEDPRGPYWQLFVEGFATEFEREAASPQSFRWRTGRADWLSWCERHRAWLATKFLRDVRARRSLRPFFGSWYPIRGQIECGYWLGAEIIREWKRTSPWRQVAVLTELAVRKEVKRSLQRIASA